MRTLAIILLPLSLVACADLSHLHDSCCASDGASGGASSVSSMTSFRSDALEWKDGPPSLPPGAKFVVLEGDPAKPGYFALRLKAPDGYRIPPHTHPQVERVTVISGTLHLGMGATFDQSKGNTLPAGSYMAMPTGMQHFAWTEGETIIQITTLGPWQINYINPADDPRKK